MANTTETATFNVKSNIGEVTKDASGLVGEFKVMGVSLNGIKTSFVAVGRSAKASFATIKAGIASSGIGALVLAVASLATYFTSTKAGADSLSKGLVGLNAGFTVLIDRVSMFAEGLTMMFNPMTMRKGAKMMKEAFQGIGAEIKNEVSAMTALEERLQSLRDAENEFMVQKAATRQEIERARLIAEDETKAASERLGNLKKALDLEEKTTRRELELAAERVAIQQEQMALSNNLVADEEKLAQLKTDLIEKETASIKMRRRVVTEVNSLEREIAAEEKARRGEEVKGLVDMDNMFERSIKKRIDLIGELNKAEDFSFEKKKTIEKSLQQLSEERIEWDAMTQNEKLNLTKNTLNDLTKIAGEETAAGKAMAITSTTIDTFQSAQASYKSLAGIPVIGPALGGIAAAAAVAMGLKNIAAIRSANSSGASSGGGSTVSAPASTATPAPQMMSGAFELSGGVEPEPTRAYVVTDEMTNSQNQLANIRRRATI